MVVVTINDILGNRKSLFCGYKSSHTTRLENLNDDLKYNEKHNPIHQIQKRRATPMSIINKLTKRGYKTCSRSTRRYFTDIVGAGVKEYIAFIPWQSNERMLNCS